MPREILTIQVGQCGNQMALAFWELLLKEHLNSKDSSLFDESFSSFFKNMDSSNKIIPIYQVSAKKNFLLNKIKNIRARTVIVDTEEGVINQLKKSSVGSLFEQKQVKFVKLTKRSSMMFQGQETIGLMDLWNMETSILIKFEKKSGKKWKFVILCSPSF